MQGLRRALGYRLRYRRPWSVPYELALLWREGDSSLRWHLTWLMAGMGFALAGMGALFTDRTGWVVAFLVASGAAMVGVFLTYAPAEQARRNSEGPDDDSGWGRGSGPDDWEPWPRPQPPGGGLTIDWDNFERDFWHEVDKGKAPAPDPARLAER